MKKYHLYLWIVALVGLTAACSQDETDALQTANGESNRVTLTVSLPAGFAQPQPQSRALPTAPANHKLRCILEVWDTETTPSLKIRQEICPAAGDTQIDFSFALTTTGTYKALLWADYILETLTASPKDIAGLTGVNSYGGNYYITTNGLKEVETIDAYPKHPEAWDAFCANLDFTKSGMALTIPTVTLTRPLMKLTIAEKNAERFASCKQVKATFDIPSRFDVATGTATGTGSRSINTYDDWLNKGNDIVIGGQTCKTLFCLYLFANAADATMDDIKLEFTATEQGKSLPTVTIPAGIPVKRNYCVNAAGNLIGEPPSPAVNMTVDINSDWKTPDEEYDADIALARNVLDPAKTEGTGDNAKNYEYTITTAEQLAALATLTNAEAVITGCTSAKYSEANYVLGKDIDLSSYSSWTPIGGMFYGTFDGQGHTISNMNVSITSQTTSEIFGGLFGILLGTVSNLIVEGDVTVNGAGNCSAGGICGRQASETIEFCRFNGSVSSTTSGSSSWNYAGGIIGDYSGVPTITGCIANAKVTISGRKADKSAAGGLAGNANGTNCKYSAWNSDSSNGTADMIGKNENSQGSQGKGNKSFTNISGLNDLLSGINDGVSGSTYIWQAGSTDTDYPVLVQRTPVGN